MMDLVQLTGYVVVGLAAFYAVMVTGSFALRTASARQRSAEDLTLFRERARILLERTAIERDRTELSWNGKRKFVVAKREFENPAADVCSFYLKPHDQRELPPFKPGQFLTFELNIPGQSSPVIRCYSLSQGAHIRDSYRVSIKKQGAPPKAPEGTPPGLSSNFFHEGIEEGAIVEAMAPAGEFYLDEESGRPVVLIGGGVGLTPVLSMLDTLVASGSNREIWFFYGARHQKEHAMFEHMKQVDRDNPNVHMEVCYSGPTDECVAGEHYKHKGYVAVELMKSLLPSNNFEFYICGPPPMMETIVNDLEAWGVPEEDINFEAFGPATVKKSHDAPALADGTTFTVEFSRSNKTVEWKPADGTLLELGEDNGIKINCGCRAGNCGACLTAVKGGDVEYLHKPGKKPEAGSCLVCIARPNGPVVLDA
jgi:ferredoxin-NADP reductase